MTTDQHLAWCAAWNRAIVAGLIPYEAWKLAQAAAASVKPESTTN